MKLNRKLLKPLKYLDVDRLEGKIWSVYAYSIVGDSLTNAPIDKQSILRADGDMYESTHNILINLYHKLSPDVFCIIDDYSLWACRRAVQDFMQDQGIHDKIIEIDPISAFLEIKCLVEPSSRANLLYSTLF